MQNLLFLLFTAFSFDGTCKSILNGLCTNCGQDLLVEGFCYKACPDGYKMQGQSCVQKTPVILFLNFENQTFYQEN